MSSKSAQNKIKQYSGVAKNVREKTKSAQPQQEEPRISLEQVTAAFKSFGFEPNERNNNDIGFWTTKPVSDGPKLMDELRKRRMEINNEEDEIAKSKKTLPRLSDQDIAALFDEYGLPNPDPTWAREHLPNDPIQIRKILEMQRKMADTMMKNEAKVATTPPPTPQTMPPTQQPQMPMGQGGPIPQTPLGGQGDMMGPTSPIKPFFIGDNAIVKILNPQNPNASTVWLIDAKKKVLRPFSSEAAFKNAFEDPAEAEKAVTTISTKELGPGGSLEGFEPLKGGEGIRDDGSMNKIDFSLAQIQNNYGKPVNPANDAKAMSMLDGMFGLIKKQQK